MSKEDGMVELPDGSGAFIGSFPLPKDRWLTDPDAMVQNIVNAIIGSRGSAVLPPKVR